MSGIVNEINVVLLQMQRLRLRQLGILPHSHSTKRLGHLSPGKRVHILFLSKGKWGLPSIVFNQYPDHIFTVPYAGRYLDNGSKKRWGQSGFRPRKIAFSVKGLGQPVSQYELRKKRSIAEIKTK